MVSVSNKSLSKLNLYILIIFLFSSNIYKAQIFSPSLQEGIDYIANYIKSSEYDTLSNKIPQINLIDSIYSNAQKFYKDDISETLLAMMIVCLPLNKFDISIPIIGVKLQLNLPAPINISINEKKNKLPKYFITSPSKINDIDKLSHFFGNAFWSYNLNNTNFSTILGYCVEYFESVFKVSGALDYRDLKVNRLGEQFGLELNINKTVLPSVFFEKILTMPENNNE